MVTLLVTAPAFILIGEIPVGNFSVPDHSCHFAHFPLLPAQDIFRNPSDDFPAVCQDVPGFQEREAFAQFDDLRFSVMHENPQVFANSFYLQQQLFQELQSK